MAHFPTTMSRDGVQVTLTEKEAAELAAIRVPRDAAYAEYDAKWQDLYRRAAERQGVIKRLDEIGVAVAEGMADESL